MPTLSLTGGEPSSGPPPTDSSKPDKRSFDAAQPIIFKPDADITEDIISPSGPEPANPLSIPDGGC